VIGRVASGASVGTALAVGEDFLPQAANRVTSSINAHKERIFIANSSARTLQRISWWRIVPQIGGGLNHEFSLAQRRV
jgi:hypothetical protein